MTMQLDIHPEYYSQAIITTITVKNVAKRVRFRLDYLEEVDKWVVAIYDAQSGEPYCENVPLVSSVKAKNDLLAPYAYKNIGELVCVPIQNEPSSVDPQRDNLGEFAVIWGDEIA